MATLVLDDRSPDISYTSGLWVPGGVSSEYNSTTTWINGTGGVVSLQFTGIRVSVWGTIGNTADGANPSTSYAIDGGDPFLFSAIQDSDIHYQQMFFLSDALDPTSHSLTIETLSPGAAYYLDFIQISIPSADQLPTTTVTTISTALTLENDIPTPTTTTEKIVSTDSTRLISTQTTIESTGSDSTSKFPVPVATTTASTTPAFANSAPISSTSIVTNSSTSNVSTPIETSNNSASSRPVPVAAIVGGSLGGLVLIACIFLILRFMSIRRRKVKLEKQPETEPRLQRFKMPDTVLYENGHAAPTRARNLVTPFPMEKPESPPSYASLTPP